MKSIRAFIALELAPGVISLLEKVQQDLKQLNIRARWVRPENIHLTLKFLGDINPGDVDRIGDAMIGAAADISSLTLSVRTIGVFPGIKRPRVIWAYPTKTLSRRSSTTAMITPMVCRKAMDRSVTPSLKAAVSSSRARIYQPYPCPAW